MKVALRSSAQADHTGEGEVADTPADAPPARPPRTRTPRFVWRLTPAQCLGIALALGVVGGYFAYVLHYAVNGIYWDEWNWVAFAQKGDQGTLGIGDLWQQHNEERMIFPNLIAMVLIRLDHLNDVHFMILSAALLTAGFLCLAVAVRHELARHPLAYLPCAVVLFSAVQYQNSLWSFQIAWYLGVACLAAAFLLLTSPARSRWRLAAAMIAGAVASYSVFQGLIVWPVGLLLLAAPGVSGRRRIGWGLCGALVTAGYFYGLDFSQLGGPPLSQFPAHLGTALAGVAVTVGSLFPGAMVLTPTGEHYTVAIALGAAILAAGALVIIAWLRQGRSDRMLTVSVALVMTGVLFDISLMPGRLSAGVINGTVSRYTTFNLLLLCGAYSGLVRAAFLEAATASKKWLGPAAAAAGACSLLVFLQATIGERAGLLAAAQTRSDHAEAASLSANYTTAPPLSVTTFSYPPSYAYFQQMAQYVAAAHLNIFADGESAGYQSTGLLEGGVVDSPMPVPPELGDIHSDPSAWRAWLAMSSVYEQRPDLALSYPGNSVEAARQMVGWVSRNATDPAEGIYGDVLRPYAQTYQQWALLVAGK